MNNLVLSEKFTSEATKDQPENQKKIVLSNEGYAVCEFIEALMNEVKTLRRNI